MHRSQGWDKLAFAECLRSLMEQRGHWGLGKGWVLGQGTVCHPRGAQRGWGPSQVRRHRSIHEVDISDLEAALRSDDPGKVYETPQEEIARLRKMELEPQHYDVDINKEVRAGCPGGDGSLGTGHPSTRGVDPSSCVGQDPVATGRAQPGACPCPGGAGGEWGGWVLEQGRVPGTGARLSPSRCTQLSTPDKVLIPERYVELEPDTPLSPEEMKEKQKKVERIKTLIAKSR